MSKGIERYIVYYDDLTRKGGGAQPLCCDPRKTKIKEKRNKNRVLSQAVNVRSEPRAHGDLSSASLS